MKSYKSTVLACYVAGISQAVIVCFAPLLVLTFQKDFGLSMQQITLMLSFNFFIQLVVDAVSTVFIRKLGCRRCMVLAHICCSLGLVGLPLFPRIMAPYPGLMLATFIYAIGGGIQEVLVSPLLESCPTKGKSAAMSLLHSFFCWGSMAVIMLSTVFFTIFGRENWPVLSCLWATIPALNAIAFTKVPIVDAMEEGRGTPIRELLRSGVIWVLLVLMICSGAAEQGISQWASAFAERGLKVSKTVGDLAGPCLFALLMGISRVFYAVFAKKLDLEKYIIASGVLCIFSYILCIVPLGAVVNLIGCALCGLAVGIVWPGVLSVAANRCPAGGSTMFALLALGGDIGCSVGPALVGAVSGTFGGDLKAGITAALIFPVVLLIAMTFLRKIGKSAQKQEA